MPIHPPSHFVPESSEGAFGLALLYSLTLIAALSGVGCAGCGGLLIMRPLDPVDVILIILFGFGIVALEVALVAVVRHYRYVRPYRRKAGHRCPDCGYSIGEALMKQGCPECGWRRR